MYKKGLVIALVSIFIAGCAEIPVQTGGGASAATGSAAGSSTQNANSDLQRCDRPLGTLGIIERHDEWYWWMNRKYGVESTEPILRLIAQQSNCFVVVERSDAGLDAAMTERDLQESGELRSNSNFGKGQIAAADYALKPTMIFRDNDTGGVGGAIGGLFGSVGAAVGGALNYKQAQALLTLVDNRSTVQVAAAEGSAKGFDVAGFGARSGTKTLAALSAYTKTPEGKVVVGALFDAYNNMVIGLRNYNPQQSATGQGHGSGGVLQVN